MPENFKLSLLRADDLLALGFEFLNLRLDANGGNAPRLVRADAGLPAFVIVHFPPQHLAEEVFTVQVSQPPVGSILTGSSRLAFRVPDQTQVIPLTLEGLLDWTRYELAVAPNALPPGAESNVEPAPPTAEHTAIELPYRLIISPDASAGWEHASQAVTHEGRTELWHTRLRAGNDRQPGLRNDLGENGQATVRAIWSPDMVEGDNQFRGSLTVSQRTEIVRLSSDFSIIIEDFTQLIETAILGPPAEFSYQPRPVPVDRLMLSSLGGWLHAHSAWDFPEIDGVRLRLKGADSINGQQLAFSLTDWRHITGMGRDQYVRTVDKGFLYPFGNRASLVTVTEREFRPAPITGESVAYLAQRRFIVVQQPEQDYASMHDAFASAGREMPIIRIRITTLTTPNLDAGKHDEPFVPHVAGGPPFEFQIEGQDLDGSRLDFAVAMIFVPLQNINDASKLAELYAGRRANLRGQRVAFAKSFERPGAATLATAAISFGAQQLAAFHPPFLPVVERADVTIPAIAHLLGSTDTSGSTTILFHEAYLAKGFAADNHGQAFAKVDQPFDLHIPAEKAGRLVTPSMSVDGLSLSLGAVSSVDDIAIGKFDPQKAFGKLDSKLLGTIELKTLIEAVDAPPPGEASLGLVTQVPKLLTTRTATEVTTSYTWKPRVNRINDPPLVTTARTGLSIRVLSTAPLDGNDGNKPPTFTVNGTLTAFALNLMDVITITFDSLSFTSTDGSKGDLKATGIDVEFTGVLKFVETLAHILPASGFSDGPAIAVTAQGITTSYSLSVPNAGVGVFSLENIALSASLFLPFVDQPPSLRLAFSEPHHPFLVTVSLIGGGGYFGIVVNTKGVEKIDGALDLGGNISVDLVVASANVHVLAGFYFAVMKTSQENQSDTVTDFIFTAFVRIGGSVEVLGIVGISVEIFVELTYQPNPLPGTISGRASVTVGVHLLMFSKSIVLSVGCCFEIGTGALALKDPSFDDMVTLSDWTDYCRAFA